MQLLKSEYYELPSKYNRTIIRLLVQSPTRMYVYWETSDETVDYFTKTFGNYANCKPALKITNITKNYSYFVEVDPYANNYYIEVDDSGCDYKVELGRYTSSGYQNIYTSNVATVPSPLPSNVLDYQDGILFQNYLCIANKRHVKVFASKENYRKHFENQNHTVFELKKNGSSEIYQGSSDNLLGSSENFYK